MIETMNGNALKLQDGGLQVSEDLKKVQPLGQPGGLREFIGMRREGGSGNNQRQEYSNVNWAAPNGKRLYLDTTTSTPRLYLDGSLIYTYPAPLYHVGQTRKTGPGYEHYNGYYTCSANQTGGNWVISVIQPDTKQIVKTWSFSPAISGYTREYASGLVINLKYSDIQEQGAFYYTDLKYKVAGVDQTKTFLFPIIGAYRWGDRFLVIQRLNAFTDFDQSFIVSTFTHGGAITDYTSYSIPFFSQVTETSAKLIWTSPHTNVTNFLCRSATFTDASLTIASEQNVGALNITPSSNRQGKVNPSNPYGPIYWDGSGAGPSAYTNTGATFNVGTQMNYIETKNECSTNSGEMFIGMVNGINCYPIGFVIRSGTGGGWGQLITPVGDIKFDALPGMWKTNIRSSVLLAYTNNFGVGVWQDIEKIERNISNPSAQIIFRNIDQNNVMIQCSASLAIVNTQNGVMSHNYSGVYFPLLFLTGTNTFEASVTNPVNTSRGYSLPGANTNTANLYTKENLPTVINIWRNDILVSGEFSLRGSGPPTTETPIPSLRDVRSDITVPLFTGTALRIANKWNYAIENQYDTDFVFFRLFGSLYAFDGINIQICQETGGGIIQGLSISTDASGLTFMAAGANAAYFKSQFGNAIYVFDGGRSITKLTDCIQLPPDTLNISAYQSSAQSLYLGSFDGAAIYQIMEGVFGKIRLYEQDGRVADNLSLIETTKGLFYTYDNQVSPYTSYGTFIPFRADQDGVTRDRFEFVYPYMGLGENQRLNVQEIVWTIKTSDQAPASVNLTFDYQTEFSTGNYTNNKTITTVGPQILRLSYKPPVTAVLAFSPGIKTTDFGGDIVILDCTIYYTPEGPACYGASQVVNGG